MEMPSAADGAAVPRIAIVDRCTRMMRVQQGWKQSPGRSMHNSGASAVVREIATRLVAYEAAIGPADGAEAPPAFLVCEKMRPPLSTLTGAGGFRTLLTRALDLAKREDPELHAVRVKEDGSLEGITRLPRKDAQLVEELINLLITFIGEGLTMRLIYDIWPDLDDARVTSAEKQFYASTQ